MTQATECAECGGSGAVMVDSARHPGNIEFAREVSCQKCDGTGRATCSGCGELAPTGKASCTGCDAAQAEDAHDAAKEQRRMEARDV